MNKLISFIVLALTALSAAAAPRASLLTAMPGREVYELEGHTALRLTDDATGEDYVVNWGIFDFNTPNFIGRFVAGQTDYLCAAYPTRIFLADYSAQGRAVVEQPLRLDSLQIDQLQRLIAENLRPKNRTYRYNYVLDNCATRPLAFIEAAAGRKLLSDSVIPSSFRSEMERYHAEYPWYQFGIDLALGRALDRPITRRQAAFAPVELMEQLAQTDLVGPARVYPPAAAPPEAFSFPLSPLAAGLICLLLCALSCLSARAGRWADTVLFGVQFLAGCILTYLVFVSTHEATSPNLLLLWLNPFCVLGAVLPWLKSAKKARISYFFANFALLILLCVGAPLLGRTMNVAFWPLIAAGALRSFDNIRRCLRPANRS